MRGRREDRASSWAYGEIAALAGSANYDGRDRRLWSWTDALVIRASGLLACGNSPRINTSQKNTLFRAAVAALFGDTPFQIFQIERNSHPKQQSRLLKERTVW